MDQIGHIRDAMRETGGPDKMRSVDYPKAIKAGRDWLIPRKWAEGFVRHKKSGGP